MSFLFLLPPLPTPISASLSIHLQTYILLTRAKFIYLTQSKIHVLPTAGVSGIGFPQEIYGCELVSPETYYSALATRPPLTEYLLVVFLLLKSFFMKKKEKVFPQDNFQFWLGFFFFCSFWFGLVLLKLSQF